MCSKPVALLPAFMMSERLGYDVDLPWRKSEYRRVHADGIRALWDVTPDSNRRELLGGGPKHWKLVVKMSVLRK